MATRDHEQSLLVELVVRYIVLLREEWPAACVRRPDYTIDAAHNYGLGLIRMLAEYHVVTCRQDLVSVDLAVRLEVARQAALVAIRKQAEDNGTSAAAGPASTGRKWRSGRRVPGESEEIS